MAVASSGPTRRVLVLVDRAGRGPLRVLGLAGGLMMVRLRGASLAVVQARVRRRGVLARGGARSRGTTAAAHRGRAVAVVGGSGAAGVARLGAAAGVLAGRLIGRGAHRGARRGG